MSLAGSNERADSRGYQSGVSVTSPVQPSAKELGGVVVPMGSRGDAQLFMHSEGNEKLLQRIQKLEEDNRALALNLTSSLHETKIAVADRRTTEAKYAKLVQAQSSSAAHIVSLKAQNQQYSCTIDNLRNTIMQLETKLDIRRDENAKLKDCNASLTAGIEETRVSLSEKTKAATQLEEHLDNLHADLQVYEHFTRIGISLRHRTLEWEHPFREQDQSLIDEGNKVSHFSTCLADAQLYRTPGCDAVLPTQPSRLSVLLGEPRRDAHIYKTFYGSSPANVANFADVEEFVQMLDYRGAMFKFLGRAEYAQSRFAALVKEMSGLIQGKGKEEMRSAFRAEKAKRILMQMGMLYGEAARKHNQARAEKKRVERQKKFEKNTVDDL